MRFQTPRSSVAEITEVALPITIHPCSKTVSTPAFPQSKKAFPLHYVANEGNNNICVFMRVWIIETL